MIFVVKFSKGHNPVKNVLVELQFLIFAHCLMVLYICTKFHENISKVSESLSGHDFCIEIFKGA